MMASENETWFHPVWINAGRRRVATQDIRVLLQKWG